MKRASPQNAIDLLHSCAHEDLEKAATFASAVAALNHARNWRPQSVKPSLEGYRGAYRIGLWLCGKYFKNQVSAIYAT